MVDILYRVYTIFPLHRQSLFQHTLNTLTFDLYFHPLLVNQIALL